MISELVRDEWLSGEGVVAFCLMDSMETEEGADLDWVVLPESCLVDPFSLFGSFAPSCSFPCRGFGLLINDVICTTNAHSSPS